ncbi:MAG: hypothetical protein RR012_01290 [Oscillospiraceae bacterium]
MTTEKFENTLYDTLTMVKHILGNKAKEYAREDRLHNFKVAADLAKTTPEMALRGMLAKHIISVWDLINDLEKGDLADIQMWDEKIIDCINYFILLRALVFERHEDEFKKLEKKLCNEVLESVKGDVNNANKTS